MENKRNPQAAKIALGVVLGPGVLIYHSLWVWWVGVNFTVGTSYFVTGLGLVLYTDLQHETKLCFKKKKFIDLLVLHQYFMHMLIQWYDPTIIIIPKMDNYSTLS